MKTKKDNPLIRLVNQGKVDLVIAPSMALVGRFGMRGQRDLLVNQHLEGVQRVGIVPSIGVTETNYLVVQTYPLEDERPNRSLERAMQIVDVFRQEQVVFSVLSDDLEQCTLTTTTFNIPSHLERGALLNEEMFQVWFLFEREVDLGRAWLTLQALLLSLGFNTGVRILPYPHFRAKQHVEDVVWLPYFNGNSEIVRSQTLGGMKDGCSTMIDTSNKSPTRLAQLPSVLDEIDYKEFGRVFEIAEPFLENARALIPRWPSAPESQTPPQHNVGTGTTLDYFDPDQGQVVNSSTDSYAPPTWSNNALVDSEESRRKPNKRVWQAVYNFVRRSVVSAGIFFHGDPLAKNVETVRPILRSQVLTFPEQHLCYWRVAIEEILGVESHWTENLIWEELRSLDLKSITLAPILMRARAAGLPDLRIALILIQWLAANGGEFLAREDCGCLRYQGVDYPIASAPPFSTLVWRLTQDTGQSLQITNEIADALQSDVLVRAGSHKEDIERQSQAKIHHKDNITENDIASVVRELFDFTTRSDEMALGSATRFIKVETCPEKVTISGTADKLCIVLRNVLPGAFEFTPALLLSSLEKGVQDLMGIGVTWEEVPMGRGKRREIRLKQSRLK